MNLAIPSKRIVSVDILRGIIMVVMALDHARDYFSNYKGDPLDFSHASGIMFFTRWITNFCAPVFVFHAGTSAFLSLSRGKKKNETARLLLTRGLWLIVLELTIIRFGWQFNVDYRMVFVQVIWAIGWSMICLAALIYLPLPAIAAIGLIIIFGHDSLDQINAKSFGQDAVIWNIIHEQGMVHYGHNDILFVLYPLVPWVGVMATGYCFGRLLQLPERERDKCLYSIGIGSITLFIILRYSNLYGNPTPWHAQPVAMHSVLSFINCAKYPPSLLYLLMTLGPAITLMPLLEKFKNPIGNFFMVYGRVPMFYYILHIYLLHLLALISGVLLGYPASNFTANGALFDPANKWGFPLTGVYIYWLAVVLILYYPCKWFMKVKATHKKWWLSYL